MTRTSLTSTLLMIGLLSSAAPGVSRHSLETLVTTCAGLVAIAAIACWLPARRAAAIDPVISLRAE